MLKEVENMITALETMSILNSVESKLYTENEFKRITREKSYVYNGLDKIPDLNFWVSE